MKIRFPYLVQDRRIAEIKGLVPIEHFDWEPDSSLRSADNWHSLTDEDMFLDGPVSTRVALLDFEEESGQLRPAISLRSEGDESQYDVPEDINERSFQALSAFATVLRTLQGFETSDVLGRRLRWAVKGQQLLVVPFAGQWANAFYERESASLQFFSFQDAQGETVHSSQSFDIVAHETGHAILDAVAPSLYDTLTPESLAIHEAVADLTALVMSISSPGLRSTLLAQTGGSISGRNAFTWIAEEFGKARGGLDGAPYLRNLANKETMESVGSSEPHDLSEVLSGALFETLTWIYEQRKAAAAAGELVGESQVKSLIIANWIFRRLAFRALDYLPPGEISFRDYGRAIWAADRNSNPGNPEYREHIAQIFVTRKIVANVNELSTPIPDSSVVLGIDLQALASDDWLAYDFANRHRELLHVPDNVQSFRVLDRLQVTKKTYRSDGKEAHFSELLFKIAWEVTEDNDIPGLSRARGVTFGTTLAINTDTHQIAALITTNANERGQDQAEARTRRLEQLLDADAIGTSAPGSATMNTSGGTMRLTGTGRALHLASGFGFELRPCEENEE